MKGKRIIALLLALSMAFAMVACGNSANNAGGNAGNGGNSGEGENVSGGTVKIGLVTAVTGSNSLVGEEAQEGAQLAVEEINAAGGVNGQQLEIVVTDEVDNLEMSVLATQELLADDEIMGIIGSMYSTYNIAAMPSVAEYGMPYLAMGLPPALPMRRIPTPGRIVLWTPLRAPCWLTMWSMSWDAPILQSCTPPRVRCSPWLIRPLLPLRIWAWRLRTAISLPSRKTSPTTPPTSLRLWLGTMTV